MNNTSVLQQWVEQIPWKQQSILFSALRGPDQEYLSEVKKISRWMRSVSQNNADPNKDYMKANDRSIVLELLAKELEFCTCHFTHHFADGLAVIAYHHPDRKTAMLAAEWHYFIAEEVFHFVPESVSAFLLRHRDQRDGIDPVADVWSNLRAGTYSNWIGEVEDRIDADAVPQECKCSGEGS